MELRNKTDEPMKLAIMSIPFSAITQSLIGEHTTYRLPEDFKFITLCELTHSDQNYLEHAKYICESSEFDEVPPGGVICEKSLSEYEVH
jgi:hypothetical protein